MKKGRKELAGNKDVAIKQFLFMDVQMEHAARYSISSALPSFLQTGFHNTRPKHGVF
jgi:hypothetical protein